MVTTVLETNERFAKVVKKSIKPAKTAIYEEHVNIDW